MFDALPTFPDTAPAFYPEQNATGRDTTATLGGRRGHVRTSADRQYIDARKVANAAKELERLPAAGTTYHGIMRGNFDGFDFIEAIAQLAGRPLAELNICTLGFNERNVNRLIGMADAGSVKRITFICSHFWRSHDGDIYTELHHALTSRGHQCAAVRCHAKILLFTFAGRAKPADYALEMSANLRTCRNLEQFSLTADAGLVKFHRSWMYEILEAAGRGGDHG